MKLDNAITEQLKTAHPEEWGQFQKHLDEYKTKHGECDEEVALYFYSAGARQVGGLVREMGSLLAEIPTL